MSNIDQFVYLGLTPEKLLKIKCRLCGLVYELSEFAFSTLVDTNCNCQKSEVIK